MISPRILTWVHRIGYVCTGIVLLILVAMLIALSLESWRIRQRAMAETGTHEGHFVSGRVVEDHARRLLEILPAENLHANALRFVAMPMLADQRSIVSIEVSDAGDARGTLITVEGRQDERVTQTNYTISQTFASAFLSRFDSLTADYEGDATDDCLDGSAIGFERIKDGKVTSGIGNAGCSAHYRAIGAEMLAVLRHASPRLDLPQNADWYPSFPNP